MEKIGIQIQPKAYQDERKYGHIYPNGGNQTSSLDNLFDKFSDISQLLVPSCLMTLINHDNNNNDDHDSCTKLCDSSNSLFKFKKLTRATTDMVIRCVVLFKQSPIPGKKTDIYIYVSKFYIGLVFIIVYIGLLYLIFSYFMHLILWLEHQFDIVEIVQDFGMECIKVALIIEEKYCLHEYAPKALYSTVSVLLRTIVACKNTVPCNNINH